MSEKKKGQTTKGKMRGKILMGGSIGIAGPGVLKIAEKKEGGFFQEADHVEFDLKIEEAKKFTFTELTPFFDLTEADIDILTEARNGDQVSDNFTVEFHDGQDRMLEILFSVDQVRALAEILEKYITAHDSWERLEKPFHVSL